MPSQLGIKLSVEASGLSRDPLSILGQQSVIGWWDAADIGSIELAPGDDSVILEGAHVGRWKDKSSYHHDFVQDSFLSCPIWLSAGINGRPSVRFDGASQFMVAADTAALRPAVISVIISFTSVAGARVIIGYPFNTTHQAPFFDWLLFGGGDSTLITRIGGSVLDITLSSSMASPSVLSYDTFGGGVYQNGASVGTGQSIATLVYPNVAGLHLGANSSQGELLTGDVNQIILSNRVWTAAERNALHDYCRLKIGL